ncbi:FAD-dependent monooxygenase [Rhodoligotrophos appendicifer]|uniref:FAD-dependent monooxygenase n=1 Tax=Rhodoligotrophos appendicifer TaxID=987056 RepID=UPI001FE351DB|nr:FAD-dependent monooxygenase [Rhodoligotrophos appendicifer]
MACALLQEARINFVFLPGVSHREADPRTTALMQGSIAVLEKIGLWPDPLERDSAPLRTLKIVDQTGNWPGAPTVTFDAAELGNEPFGWNVPNSSLLASLSAVLASAGNQITREGKVRRAEILDDRVVLHLDDKTMIAAQAVIAADGASSVCRDSAGIKTYGTTYRQLALATSFDHELSHDNCSTEYHRPGGPLTTVPLPGKRSSLVWMERPDEINRLMALGEAEFSSALTIALNGELGAVGNTGARAAFPARSMISRSFAAKRIFLVGEAAHVLPPIGAQGLNLGFRDAEAASARVIEAIACSKDPGGNDVLEGYDRDRRRDVLPRGMGVDLMNRSLLSQMLPGQLVRAAGLLALQRFGRLRRTVMREGIGA